MRPKSDEGCGLHSVTNMVDGLLTNLRLNASHPLVKLVERLDDGRIAVVLYDYPDGRPGLPLEYEFSVRDITDAMNWVAHLGEKSWVTVDHLRVFAELALQEFAGGRR